MWRNIFPPEKSSEWLHHLWDLGIWMDQHWRLCKTRGSNSQRAWYDPVLWHPLAAGEEDGANCWCVKSVPTFWLMNIEGLGYVLQKTVMLSVSHGMSWHRQMQMAFLACQITDSHWFSLFSCHRQQTSQDVWRGVSPWVTVVGHHHTLGGVESCDAVSLLVTLW